ncbi:MAG TPA: YciI family protein [Candidatus Dormibacteraeota bacterium]|nr:YciI family protein [Candidatus Dormibacteraeota bacterium]
MKYVLLFGGSMEGVDQLESGVREQAMADYEKSGQWFEKYTKAGKVVGGEELQGPSTATTVSRKNGKVTVTDGPFIEAKEVIGGYAVIEVADLDEALEIAKEWPGTVEIRPVVDHTADRERALGH